MAMKKAMMTLTKEFSNFQATRTTNFFVLQKLANDSIQQCEEKNSYIKYMTRMWANAQRDGRPAIYRWRPLFNAAKFGWCPLLECRAVTDNFDNKGREVFCKVSLYKKCQWQSYSAINCLSSGINILAGGSSVPLISERKGTDPHWKHMRCTHFAS